LEDKRPQKRKKIIAPESESNDKMSVQIISAPQKKVVKKLQKRNSDNTAEDQEYKNKLKWLKDHGDLTGEEGKIHEMNPQAMKPLLPGIKLWNQ
jgi:hypothetical protein